MDWTNMWKAPAPPVFDWSAMNEQIAKDVLRQEQERKKMEDGLRAEQERVQRWIQEEQQRQMESARLASVFKW